jgi:4-hydroxy-tetrahydrodipicolinate synthase
MTDSVRWRGILPSLPTLFGVAGGIDAEAFCRVARFAVDAGATGLVTFGLAGEVSRMLDAEREELLDRLVAEVGPDVPVLTGVTTKNTRAAQALARHAERAGAAGVVIAPPTAFKLSNDDLVGYIADVAGATSLPAIVQDAPDYLSVAVGPAVVLEAAQRAPNIIAVKLETGPEGIEAWRAQLGVAFSVYGGNGGMFLLDCVRAGADGIMPGVDTVDLQVAIERAEGEGRTEEADRLFERLLPLLVFEMQSIDHYNLCAKQVLSRRGVNVPLELRAPGPRTLSRQSVARLDGYLARMGLLQRGVLAATSDGGNE